MQKYVIRYDKIDDTNGLRRDGKFALGLVVGSLAVVLLYIAFDYVWGEKSVSEFQDMAPIIISLIVAMASTYFAANALIEQRYMREAGTDPVLIAHLGQREDARELATFKVTNVGAGAALSVKLEVERPNDDAVDWQKRNFLQNIFERREPFAVVLQGQSIEFNFALGWHLLGQEGLEGPDPNLPIKPLPPFMARISYEDLAGGKYSGEFMIDVMELQSLGAQKSPQMRIVHALEKLAKR